MMVRVNLNPYWWVITHKNRRDGIFGLVPMAEYLKENYDPWIWKKREEFISFRNEEVYYGPAELNETVKMIVSTRFPLWDHDGKEIT